MSDESGKQIQKCRGKRFQGRRHEGVRERVIVLRRMDARYTNKRPTMMYLTKRMKEKKEKIHLCHTMVHFFLVSQLKPPGYHRLSKIRKPLHSPHAHPPPPHPPPRLHTPFPLISLVVSVDVKHHIYLLARDNNYTVLIMTMLI